MLAAQRKIDYEIIKAKKEKREQEEQDKVELIR